MIKLTTPASWAQDRTPAEWARHHMRVVAVLIGLALLTSYPAGVFALALLTAPKPQPAEAAGPVMHGSGVVLSMNDTLGAISIQHSGVPSLGMPAGTTAFRAAPQVFKRTEVGDQIDFSLTRQGGIYVITSADNSVTGLVSTNR